MIRLLPALLGLCLLAPTTAQRQTSKAVRATYERRAAQLDKQDAEGHYALACWCATKGLDRCARWELREVLRESPNHRGARRMLGQAFHDGKWMPLADAMKAKGLVEVDGRWLTKYDAARYRAMHKKRLDLQNRANALFQKLADRNAKTRTAALRDLVALADAEKMPALAKLAREKNVEYGRFWRRHASRRAARNVGILSINATNTQLERMNTFTTGLGNGSPVRLQLPQTRTISIGTTVAVPLGR